MMSKSSSMTGLFVGRLNRSGFLLGEIAVGFSSVVIAMIIMPILTHVSVIAVLILLIAILFLNSFYSWSFSLRRLHDLNRSGNWLLLYLPSLVLGIIIFASGFTAGFLGSSNAFLQTLTNLSSSLGIIYGILHLISIIFGVYLLFWPGNKAANKYGQAAGWKLKEILGFK